MKKITALFILLTILTLVACEEPETREQIPPLTGEYLGEELPGLELKLFAPGVVSTGVNQLNAVFFPGGKEMIWSVEYDRMKWALVMMKEIDGIWAEPQVAPFSGEYSDVDAFVSDGGNRIWYASNRPLPGREEANDNFDIWYVDRLEDGWSEPKNPGEVINSSANEFFPCVTASGNIYFQSHREGGVGQADIYKSEFVDGEFAEATLLPEPINSPGFEGDTFVSPDESYAIVATTRSERPSWADIFVCFKDEDGNWGKLVNMGEEVNSPQSENTPGLSPDGKYLFLASKRRDEKELSTAKRTYKEVMDLANAPVNGSRNIYWISSEVLKPLRALSLEK